MPIDWTSAQPTYEEQRLELERLRIQLKFLQEAYDRMRDDYYEAHRVVDFIIERRANAP